MADLNPAVQKPDRWTIDKSGEHISPFDVVPGGARQMHAVGTGFTYHDDAGTFAVETVDAPLIALGQRSPLNFSRTQPDVEQGIHSNLFNNAWGTNHRQWDGEDMRFRFVIREAPVIPISATPLKPPRAIHKFQIMGSARESAPVG